MLGPRLLDHGEGESLVFFPHHSVRESRLRRLLASLCGQNKRVARGAGKQQSQHCYFRLTRSLTHCQITPPSVPDAPLSGWFLTDWVCCSSNPTVILLFSLLGGRISYLILYPKDFDCNPVAFWQGGKTAENDRRQSTIHPQDPG